MPSVTFLVAINIPDVMPDQLLLEAGDIEEDLQRAGHDVESVVPWARPSMAATQPAGGFSSLTQPPPPTPNQPL